MEEYGEDSGNDNGNHQHNKGVTAAACEDAYTTPTPTSSSLFVDITSVVEACASSLSVTDPFICNEHSFSLLDSMAALELMDQKLDCCEIPISVYDKQTRTKSGTTTFKDNDNDNDNDNDTKDEMCVPPRPPPTDLDQLPWKDLTMKDVTYICLECIARIESMLGGAAVSDSTFTCLYAHGPMLKEMELRLRPVEQHQQPPQQPGLAHQITEKMAALLSVASVVEQPLTAGNPATATANGVLPLPLLVAPSLISSATTTTTGTGRTSSGIVSNGDNDNLTTTDATTTRLAQQSLYASVLGMVAISHLAQHIACNADIYEEEDFSIATYGLLDFFGQDDLYDTLDILRRTLQQLELERVRSKNSHNKTPNEGDDSDDFTRIGLVLGFQLDFLRASTSLAKLSVDTLVQVTLETKQIIGRGIQKLEQLQSMLPVSSTAATAIATDQERYRETLLHRSFDLYVNRPLVGNAPIRKVVFRTPQEAITSLVPIFKQMDWAVCDLLLHGTTLSKVRRMLHRISTSSVNILSRSLIILNLYFSDLFLGQHQLTALVIGDLLQLGGIPSHLLGGDDPCDNTINDNGSLGPAFVGRLAKPTYDTLKLLLLNRNRQRTYMEAVMLHEWSVLQQEAHAVDMSHRAAGASTTRSSSGSSVSAPLIQPPYFSQYVLLVTCRLMEHHVSLGIELELFFGHEELSVAFWYRDFLLSTLLNALVATRRQKMATGVTQRALAAAAAAMTEAAQAPSTVAVVTTGKKGKKKGGSKKKVVQQQQVNNHVPNNPIPTDEDMQNDLEFMFLGLQRNMCRGIVRFIAALHQAKILHIQSYEFTSPERKFQKRFEAFRDIVQPPPLTHEDYQQGSNFSSISQVDLLASVMDGFKQSKADVDKLLQQAEKVEGTFSPVLVPELKVLAKVCVGNSVFAHKLTQLVSSSNETASGKVSFDFLHKQFCSIKIT